MVENYVLKNFEDSHNFAQKFAKTLLPGDVVTFQGDLGSGKTFLCREIIRYFCGVNTLVPSPTFNLLQIYNAQDFNIYHYDLYRLKSPEGLWELEFDEALDNNISLIEWPQIAQNFLPKAISINLRIEDDTRICSIELPK